MKKKFNIDAATASLNKMYDAAPVPQPDLLAARVYLQQATVDNPERDDCINKAIQKVSWLNDFWE